VLVVAAPVGDGRQLVAVQRLSEIRTVQAGLLASGAIGLLAALAVAWFAGGLLAHRLTRPLLDLQAGAERIASGDFGAQVSDDGDVEVAALARSFNHMSRRVADAHAAQQAFVGDVSHEIRTPLTSIAGFAHALQDGTIADEAGRQRAAGVIEHEARRIAEITTTLLSLSQLDAGSVELLREPVDLAVLCDALAGRFGVVAVERGVSLAIEVPGEPRPLADPERLLQCVSALVDNALAHARPSGDVRVSAWCGDSRWRVIVDDDGPGIPPEKRDIIFDRFTRLDESRSSESGGAGLGLSICARLVNLMGGRVWAEQSPLGGARLVIDLPEA
jgi:signal transduction histidine kinase